MCSMKGIHSDSMIEGYTDRKLFVGFKGKNNVSQMLVKSISKDSFLLTNSFCGILKDIEAIDESYDSVFLFGIDKNLKNSVRIERVAKMEYKEFSALNLEKLSVQLDEIGIANGIYENPTHYLCNYAYWYLLRKFNGKAVLIHIPSIKNANFDLIKGICRAFR